MGKHRKRRPEPKRQLGFSKSKSVKESILEIGTLVQDVSPFQPPQALDRFIVRNDLFLSETTNFERVLPSQFGVRVLSGLILQQEETPLIFSRQLVSDGMAEVESLYTISDLPKVREFLSGNRELFATLRNLLPVLQKYYGPGRAVISSSEEHMDFGGIVIDYFSKKEPLEIVESGKRFLDEFWSKMPKELWGKILVVGWCE